MTITEFQSDLQKMTLTEALTKHGLTLHDAFYHLHHQLDVRKSRGTKPATNKYIYKHCNHYQIRKKTNGKSRAYGTYRKLYEAKLVRDALIEDGWNQNHVDKICCEVGVKRLTGQRNKRYD